MTRGAVILLLLPLLLPAWAFLSPLNSHAQTPPTVIDRGVQAVFPDRLVFNVSAESDSQIERIRLRYSILPDGTAASGVPDFQPANVVKVPRSPILTAATRAS